MDTVILLQYNLFPIPQFLPAMPVKESEAQINLSVVEPKLDLGVTRKSNYCAQFTRTGQSTGTCLH